MIHDLEASERLNQPSGLDQSDVKSLMVLLGRLDDMENGNVHFTGTVEIYQPDRMLNVRVWYDPEIEVHRLRLS
jgi:hypothetical protein